MMLFVRCWFTGARGVGESWAGNNMHGESWSEGGNCGACFEDGWWAAGYSEAIR